MREYELTVLIHPDFDADLEKPLADVRALITKPGGEITKEDNWGKKRLQYTIDKQDFATYVYIEATIPTDAVQKIDATLNITPGVMRHLLVKVDPRHKAALAAQAEKAAKEEE